MRLRKAVIPAAGLGTRFLPVTKAQPKEMLPVHNKPAIQYVVEEARLAGISGMMIVTGSNKEAIARHFDHAPDLYARLKKDKKTELLQELENIEHIGEELYWAQQGEPKGLAHAILRAEAYVANESFAVLLGDDLVTTKEPCVKTLMDLHEEYGRSIIAVSSVPKEKVGSYGIVETTRFNKHVSVLGRIVEKPKPGKTQSRLAIVGRYVFTPEVFEAIKETPEDGRLGERLLTDSICILGGKQVVYTYEIPYENWHTVGDPVSQMITSIEFASKDPRFWPEIERYLNERTRRGNRDDAKLP